MLSSSPVKHILPVMLSLTAVVASAQGRLFAIQLEAFANQEVAARRVEDLQRAGIEAYLVRSELPGKGVLYRVRVGRFSTPVAARRLGEDLRSRQLTIDFFVTAWEAPLTEEGSIPRRPAPMRNAAATTKAEPKPVVAAAPTPAEPPAPLTRVDARRADIAVSASPPPAPPASAGNLQPTADAPAKRPEPRRFVRFSDQSIGYAFDRPQTWEGGLLASGEAVDQKINAGALFRSSPDRAFLNVIWNQLDQANSPDHDNNLIVELILRSMASGEGTRLMKEVSRRVVTENGQVKTFLDLVARFELPGSSSSLDFSGKGVIVRNARGVLLVVTFFSNAGPADVPAIADRILASVTLP